MHLVTGDGEAVSLVLGDVVGEEIAPTLVGVVDDVLGRSCCDLTGGVDGADIMGFGKIVPRDNSMVLLVGSRQFGNGATYSTNAGCKVTV